ncbi:3'-5' exonuclease [Marmoricola sp. URHA0025 HA25]
MKTDWRAARFTVIDVETTGLNLKADDIVSIGVVDVVQGWVDSATSWYQLVRPSCGIGIEAAKTHGLTRDELASAPDIADVIGPLHERMRGSVLVAHAAWIERAFIDRALAPLRWRMPRDLVDTAGLSQAAGLSTKAGHAPHLESLAQELGLPVFTPHHALGDTMSTAIIMIALATRLEAERGSLLVGDLVRISRHADR